MNKNDHIIVDEVKNISIALISAIPPNLSAEAALRWSHSKNLLIKKVQTILLDDGSREIEPVLAEWRSLYLDLFGIKKDFSALAIPQKPVGLNRLMVRAANVSNSAILTVCEQTFPVEYHPLGEFGDVLDSVTQNDTRPQMDYAFWVKDLTESEMSPPPDIASPPTPRITISERLLFELKYFRETKDHLDMEKTTCCFGTRHSEGGERPVVSL